MEQKFRAFYQGDIEDYYDLTFYSQVIEGEMWFVYNKDSDIKFESSYVFGGEDWVINMCTGLTDLNNELIYEGDILPFELSNKTFEYYYIKYNDEECQFNAINKDGTKFMHPHEWRKSQVVGNIYYNEVLLDNLDNHDVGQYKIINFDGKNVYVKSKWFRNHQDLQDHIDEVYKEIYEYIKSINKEVSKLKSRNLFQRIFRKYE